MLFPSSGSTLKWRGALSEMLSTHKTSRCYNARTVISGALFRRIVHSHGCSNNDCKEGDSGSPFNYGVSHFTFILLQKHIGDCAVSSELHFHGLIVAKRQRMGVNRSLL
jgi:hypothetical protein